MQIIFTTKLSYPSTPKIHHVFFICFNDKQAVTPQRTFLNFFLLKDDFTNFTSKVMEIRQEDLKSAWFHGCLIVNLKTQIGK